MARWAQIMSESREYPSQPICGVGIVVFDQHKVLLIRRGKPPLQGNWSIPGGKQKLGETLQEAARRAGAAVVTNVTSAVREVSAGTAILETLRR